MLLTGLGILGVLGIKALYDDYQCMKYPGQISTGNGTPICFNRNGDPVVNGEICHWEYDLNRNASRLVGASGTIYKDTVLEKKKKWELMNEKAKEENIRLGFLAYPKQSIAWSQHKVTVEISTEKIIAKISAKQDRFYNWTDCRKFYARKCWKLPTDVAEDDDGIPISEEEAKKLNILFGSHILEINGVEHGGQIYDPRG